jgi:hypothetical protein
VSRYYNPNIKESIHFLPIERSHKMGDKGKKDLEKSKKQKEKQQAAKAKKKQEKQKNEPLLK